MRSRGVLRLVHDVIRPYRAQVVVVFLAMLVETGASLAAPWPIKILIDNVLGSERLPDWLAGLETLGPAQSTLIALAALSVVSIAALGAVASYVDSYYTESVGQWVANDLRMKVYHHLHRLSLAYYDTHKTGAMLSTITDDVSTIQNFASSATLSILVDLLTILGMLGVMFSLSPDFAVTALVLLPFLIVFVVRFKRAAKHATREVRQHQSEIVSVVQQGLESVRTVEAFGREEFEEARLGSASRSTVTAALRARRIKSLVSPVVSVAVAGCTAFVLWRGTALIQAGTMTIGALTVFLAYMNKVFKPIQELAKMTNTAVQALVALERMRAILDADTIIPERPGAHDLPSFQREIAFNHVAFAYQPQAPVLRDVSFTVRRGQRIGIVGPTGGGKSTVVSLIPRFYDVTSGQITIDGVDVREYRLQGLRAQIGFVLQDTVLFFGTVRDNIAYGRPGATAEEIVQAASLANAHEFVVKLPNGYDSIVGERGLTLSGGQRQRIGIARAILRNSPILILDEPTAALDPVSEQIVLEGLQKLMKGRTVLTVAHRLSTIRDADKIIVISGGVVAEEGTHDELLERGGVYAELYRVQSRHADADALASWPSATVAAAGPLG
jgi:subfamily B ATP-binding cassette protein MsbA